MVSMEISYENTKDCKVMTGKMALPNQYFAGRVGSTFIIALRDEHKILGVRCEKCNKVFVPPREYCEKCLSKLDESWVECSNEGVITNYTVVNYNDKHLPRRAPYILALIKVDGADTPFPHIVEGVDAEDVKVGMKVKAVFAEETTNTIRDLDHFEPL
jgi:uncharacterized OB-fold protein